MTLASADWLAAHLDDPDLRVVDARWTLGKPGAGREAYDAGHIPGAIYVDMDVDLAAPVGAGRHPLPDPGALALRLGTLGIGSEHRIVVYDDTGWVAARFWWMLDDLGHTSVSVLDGGYRAWIAGSHPIEIEMGAGRDRPATTLTLAPAWTKVVDRDGLRDRLGDVVLLDARAGPRYRGEIEPIDPIAGHIPTAVNAPTDGNLDTAGALLPAAALRTRYEAFGAGGETPVVLSCGSGVSACHDALAMRVAGLPEPILYPGSWSDWSTAGYPVAVGPEPGHAPGRVVRSRA
jgi:thiosulfate/3-mercaptopyruvate sulfurtransferase